jgi:hypothetical protein
VIDTFFLLQTSEGEQRWRKLQATITQSVQELYRPWVGWVVEEEQQRFKEAIAEVPWDNLSVLRLGWQPFSVDEQSEQVRIHMLQHNTATQNLLRCFANMPILSLSISREKRSSRRSACRHTRRGR